jgi:gliding motility-associated-like protein
MNKQFICLIVAAFIGMSIYGQPSATIASQGATSFCQSGQAQMKIGFTGEAPFGYSLRITNTADGSLQAYSTNLGSNGLGLYEGDLENGFYIYKPIISTGYTYELVEVFDKSNWPPNPTIYSYGGGNPIGSTLVSGNAAFVIDQVPVVNAGVDKTVCGLSVQLQAIPNYTDSQIFWDVPATGSLSDLNVANPIYSVPSTGTFTLTVNEQKGACTGKDNITITLQGSPTGVLSGDANICGSGQIPASMVLQGSSPWSFYVKNQDGSHVVNQTNVTNATHTFPINAVGSQIYSIVSITDKNGCTALASDLAGTAVSTNVKAEVWAGDDQLVCGNTSALLVGTSSLSTGTVLWTSSSSSTITSASNLSTTVSVSSNSPEKTIEYTLEIDNSGCKSNDKVVIRFAPLPNLSVISPQTTICEGTETDLEMGIDIVGAWSLEYTVNGVSKTEQFPSSPSELVLSPLVTSNYVFKKVTDKNNCANAINDSWLLTVEPKVVANAGPDQALARQYKTSLNAIDPVGTGVGSWSSVGGGKAILGDGANPITLVTNLAVGDNKFEWKVTSQICPESKDTVVISVDKYTTYNGFSPNGDGLNDVFVIEGANSDEENELSVFTAKGKLVYREKNYQNTWDGVDLNGTPLESGTYYFVFSSTGNNPIKEYLIIRR